MAEDRSPYKSFNSADSHDHWGEETGYRRLHWGAVTSLVLALFSPLAIYISGLIAIPVASLLFGFLGHSEIKRKPEIYTGARIAMTGLFVALVFGIWGSLNQINDTSYLYDQAAVQTKHWLNYLKEGKLAHAHQVMLSVQGRNHEVRDIEEFYQNDRGMLEEQNARFSRQPMKMMLEHIDHWNPDNLVVLNNVLLRSTKKNEIQLVQEYVLPLDDSDDEAIAFRIQYWRQFFPEGRTSHWQLEGIGLLDGSYGATADNAHAGHGH